MDTDTQRAQSARPAFGGMLREWRRMRGSSQLDLALHCGLSQRHLSFLESGRSRPSRGTVLNLAVALNVPLRDQNAMLLAAGFAPVYKQRSLDAPDMKPVDLALEHVLRQQVPYPAIVIDEAHTIVRANRPLAVLMSFLMGGAALPAPVNAVEAILRPDALRPQLPPTLVLWLRRGDTRLGLFSMIATVGTPMDVALQGLRLELFFPAAETTAHWFVDAANE